MVRRGIVVPETAGAVGREASLTKTAVWYGALLVVQAAATGGLVGTATDFVLKDRLGLDAAASARYGTIIGLPAYFAFLFGYARDRWSARLGGDRSFVMVEAVVAALALGLLASVGTAYLPILLAMLALVVGGRIGAAGQGGAQVLFATRRGVRDRLSAFNLGMGALVGAGTSYAAGWGAAHFPYRTLLAASAAFGLVYVALLLFAPRGAFLPREPRAKGDPAAPIAAQFAALVRSRPFLALLGMSFAYNFCPESGPSFFYYATNGLHADPELWGRYNAIISFAPFPVALLYGAFARRIGLRNRLAIAMAALLLGTLLMFGLRSRNELLPLAVVAGLANAAYLAASFDLLLGAIPKGSEGLGFAVQGTLGLLVVQISNLLGAWVYDTHGFMTCVAISLPSPLVGLLFLSLVPKREAEPVPPTAT